MADAVTVPPSSGAGAAQTARDRLAARWEALSPRDRRSVRFVAWLLAAFLVWVLAVQPAWRTARDAPAQIDQLDAQLQRMQRLALEARDIRSTPSGSGMQSTAQSAVALRAATDRLGGRGRLLVQGDRATLTLSGVDGAKLRAWLDEARKGARARPIDVQLSRGPQGYQGTMVVALGGNAS